jgi:hypothetical protein
MEQRLILSLCTCHCTEVSHNAYTLRGLKGYIYIYQTKCVALFLHALGIILFDNLHHSCLFHVMAGSTAPAAFPMSPVSGSKPCSSM